MSCFGVGSIDENFIKNWNDLIGESGKYQLRHDLIRGTVGTCGRTFAKPFVEAFLAAATDIDDYCLARKKNVYRKLGTTKRAIP
jgi:hypothetical protein